MLLIIGSFIAGFLTVLAPCVLPLLPVIIGGSISGDVADKKRPITITISLAASLFIFTILLKVTSIFINVPPLFFTYTSGIILILIGILTLFPALYARVMAKLGIEHRAQAILGRGFQNKNKYISSIIIGAALGPVFSSCSPIYAYILATILPVSLSQALVYITIYIAGLSVALLLIGYVGQRFVSKLKFASDPKGIFQRILAIIFLIVGLLIITGYDKSFQVWVSRNTAFDFDSISRQFLPESRSSNDEKLFNVEPYEAPEFAGLQDWINSDPIKISELRGKVVLVDFWTYSCINCIRNNPYLVKWHETYKDKGLVVVGVHAPEFSFEKNKANVQKAVNDQNITYPVALDNDFTTWSKFKNQAWPTSYLIDGEGMVRRVHEGEGDYDREEQSIRQLLQENGADLSGTGFTQSSDVPVTDGQTPETYLGKIRASNFENDKPLGAKEIESFRPAEDLGKNSWTLGGSWKIEDKQITARKNSTLRFNISAKEVYLVMGADKPKKVRISIDGDKASKTNFAGDDVENGIVNVEEYKLYKLVKFDKFKENKIIELELPAGVQLNAFTFGS